MSGILALNRGFQKCRAAIKNYFVAPLNYSVYKKIKKILKVDYLRGRATEYPPKGQAGYAAFISAKKPKNRIFPISPRCLSFD